MGEQSHQIILWRTAHSLFLLEDLANAAGVHPELAEKFVSYGLIEPLVQTGVQAIFSASSVERLQSIITLRDELGVNLAGIAVVLNMKERLKAAQREVKLLRERLKGEGTQGTDCVLPLRQRSPAT